MRRTFRDVSSAAMLICLCAASAVAHAQIGMRLSALPTPPATSNAAILACTQSNGFEMETYGCPVSQLGAAIGPGSPSALGLVMPDGLTLTNNAGALSVTYGATSNTAAQGNDSRIVNALSKTGDTASGAIAFSSSTPSSFAVRPKFNGATPFDSANLGAATIGALGLTSPDGTSILNSNGHTSVTPASVGAVNKSGDTMTGPLTAPSVNGAPSINWAGSATQGDAAHSAIFFTQSVSGASTATGGSTNVDMNRLWIIDNLAAPTGIYAANGLYVQDIIGAAATGSRNAFRANMYVFTKPADPYVGSTGSPAYVGVFPTTQVGVNLGGTAADYTHSQGGAWAENPNVVCATGATYLYSCQIAEFDMGLQPGTSAARKIGIDIIQGSNSTVQGSVDDEAILIANAYDPNHIGPAAGWRYGIELADTYTAWPIDANGTIFGTKMGINPETGNPATSLNAKYGIDFSQVTFSGCAYHQNTFCVDTGGDITAANVTSPSGSYSGVQVTGNGTGADGQLRAISGNTGAYLRNDSTYVYLLVNGAANSGFNATVPFQARLSTGAVTIDATGAGVSFGGAASAAGGVRTVKYLGSGSTTVSGLASLDPSPVQGDRALVTDATSCTLNSAPSGGGGATCPVYYSGSAWVAG